jgi:hypothetical protein
MANTEEPLSMRVHNAVLAAINATMRNVDDGVTDLLYTEATLTALIPLCEHAARLMGMSPPALVAMLALSLAHEAAPQDAQREVKLIIERAQTEAMFMMRIAGTALQAVPAQ